MSEEIVEEVQEESTPSPVDGVETPEVEPETVVDETPKPGSIEYTKAVEERIGKVTAKTYKAEAERDLYKQRLEQIEAENAKPVTQTTTEQTYNEPEPIESSYEDYNAYIKDVASWQFRKEQANYEANQSKQRAVDSQAKMESDFNTRVRESGIQEEHPDFYDQMKVVNLVPGILEAVLTSEKGPELAIHLANNPDVMRDINTLPPLVAARKLGSLEAKLSGEVKKKTVSKTPEPLTTVNTDTNVTTDDNPKDINEWMKKRRERELAKITQKVNGGRI